MCVLDEVMVKAVLAVLMEGAAGSGVWLSACSSAGCGFVARSGI